MSPLNQPYDEVFPKIYLDRTGRAHGLLKLRINGENADITEVKYMYRDLESMKTYVHFRPGALENVYSGITSIDIDYIVYDSVNVTCTNYVVHETMDGLRQSGYETLELDGPGAARTLVGNSVGIISEWFDKWRASGGIQDAIDNRNGGAR